MEGTASGPGGSFRRRALYLALAAFVVALDRLTKQLVIDRIPLHERIPVLSGFFDLTHVENSGAAFGLFAGPEHGIVRTLLLTGIAALVFVFVLVYALRSPAERTRLQTGLAFVLGGAVGNLIDRLRIGTVTDFLRFYIGSHEWPSFNVADSAITTGVILLAWDLWREPEGTTTTSTTTPTMS